MDLSIVSLPVTLCYLCSENALEYANATHNSVSEAMDKIAGKADSLRILTDFYSHKTSSNRTPANANHAAIIPTNSADFYVTLMSGSRECWRRTMSQSAIEIRTLALCHEHNP